MWMPSKRNNGIFLCALIGGMHYFQRVSCIIECRQGLGALENCLCERTGLVNEGISVLCVAANHSTAMVQCIGDDEVARVANDANSVHSISPI
jgi:hypothetical protein